MSEVVVAALLATLIIFILLSGIVVTILISHRRSEKDRRQISKLELDYQKELRMIESEVRESTMAQVASELHDNIGQLLTLMKFQIEKEKLREPSLESVLSPVSGTLASTMDQVRFLSHSLHNDFINDGGLLRVIAQETERVKSLGKLQVSFDSDSEEPDLSKDARTVAFRLFQEALNNALKHSGASLLQITLRGHGGLFLRLQDNGKGFDRSLMDFASPGMGLKNMPRRAALAGLECKIDSAPGEGCNFIVTSSTVGTA